MTNSATYSDQSNSQDLLESETHRATYEDENNMYTVFARRDGAFVRLGRVNAAAGQFTLAQMVDMLESGD